MKKRSSIAWRFFDRLEENNKCVGVLCKLCDQQYKFFGNTTNMRSHLTCKHPLQWELLQNGTLDESTLRFTEDDTEESTISVQPRKQYKDKNVRYSVSVKNESINGEDSIPQIEVQTVDSIDNCESDVDHLEDTEAGIHLVRQMRDSRASGEEWLEEETYLPVEQTVKRRKMPYKRIKREIESPPRRLSFKAKQEKFHYDTEQTIYQVPIKDEYSVFGEYVANKLRKVKLPKTRGNLQQLITTILWQADYGMYDSADAVRRVLSYTVEDKRDENMVVIEQEAEPNQSTETEDYTAIN